MPRYRLVVAYEGTEFHGWQKQHPGGAEPGPPLRTVQEVLEQAVRAVVREPVNLLGASRTDAGVHARGQVAAFTASIRIPTVSLARAINARLPDDVQVVRSAVVSETFDPIGDAVSKGYRYGIVHGGAHGTAAPLFDRRTTAFIAPTLDPAPMRRAARSLVGEHDFTSFTRKHHGRRSAVRRVLECTVTASNRRRLRIDVSATGFLYNMVRIIVGTLADVGLGRIDPDAVPGILAARDRTAAGPTYPPEGLCLRWILYGSDEATERRSDEG